MDENLTAFELSIKTGNTVTDVIVGDKKKAADKLGIKFQSDFSYPQSDKYNPYDIGIILNNLLTVMGSDISSVNEKISEAISRLTSSNIPASRIAGIDIKA